MMRDGGRDAGCGMRDAGHGVRPVRRPNVRIALARRLPVGVVRCLTGRTPCAPTFPRRIPRPTSRLGRLGPLLTIFLLLACTNSSSATATAPATEIADLPVATATTGAQPAQSDSDPFVRTWQRTDGPVASLAVSRTWMWGPEPFSEDLTEAYAEAPGAERRVRYYDKSRMELNDPAGDPASPWHVTNGLLVIELMYGRIQTGDNSYLPRRPSLANVAGDEDDTDAPTYATLAIVAGAEPLADGAVIAQTLSHDGVVGTSTTAAEWQVTAGPLSPETGHRVASVFWDFMNSTGPVDDGTSGTITAPLFENPYYATGLPVTEAYWVTVKVGGVDQRVLMQAFERRVLTYTPGNPDGWQVEAGNVGRHYHSWRYENEDFAQVQIATASGTVPLYVEVADTDELRSCGLMHRFDMLEDQAMIFVFTGISGGSFWNRNTEIPLQLAWLNSDGVIVGLSNMAAADRTDPNYPINTYPPGGYQYVIEANAGWFTSHGIAAGDTVDLTAALAHGSQGVTPTCAVLGLGERGK